MPGTGRGILDLGSQACRGQICRRREGPRACRAALFARHDPWSPRAARAWCPSTPACWGGPGRGCLPPFPGTAPGPKGLGDFEWGLARDPRGASRRGFVSRTRRAPLRRVRVTRLFGVAGPCRGAPAQSLLRLSQKSKCLGRQRWARRSGSRRIQGGGCRYSGSPRNSASGEPHPGFWGGGAVWGVLDWWAGSSVADISS